MLIQLSRSLSLFLAFQCFNVSDVSKLSVKINECQGGMLIGRVTEGAVSPGDSHEDGGEEHAKLYEGIHTT